MTLCLGIDLGTSNSAIAGITNGVVRVFKTPEGTDVMPSVLHRDRRSNQTVGVRAFDQAALNPDNAVEGFKRLMGTDTELRFVSTGEVLTPEQAATELLRALVGYALVESGSSDIAGGVVTIPAAFNQVRQLSSPRATPGYRTSLCCKSQWPRRLLPCQGRAIAAVFFLFMIWVAVRLMRRSSTLKMGR